jgi:hypothetical protein
MENTITNQRPRSNPMQLALPQMEPFQDGGLMMRPSLILDLTAFEAHTTLEQNRGKWDKACTAVFFPN